MCASRSDTEEEVMRWSNLVRSALFSVAICCVAMPEADAIEVFAPPGLAAHLADGTVTQVRYGGGVRRGGGGAYRGRGGYGYRGGARYGYRGGYGRYGYRGGYGRYGYRGGYGRYGYRGGYGRYGNGYGYRGYGYRPYGYGYGAAAVGAAAIGAAAAHRCWIDSYGHRVCNYHYY
jgi:hypothetical protein